MHTWQLQEAKARLSQVVKLCSQEGPQVLTVHGKEEVVMISKKDYDRLTKRRLNLFDYMQQSPLYGVELGLQRDASENREVNL